MLLDQIDHLSAQIDRLTTRIEQLIAAIPTAQGVDADGSTGPGAGLGEDAPVVPALERLDEIPGISRTTAHGIIAEIGLDMTRFPTPGHLVSWAKLGGYLRSGRGPAPVTERDPISGPACDRIAEYAPRMGVQVEGASVRRTFFIARCPVWSARRGVLLCR